MSNTIKIDRDKLETALKRKFKTDRKKTISRALGFKDNALGEALKRGTLSLKMVRALEIFDIKRISYEVDDTAPEEALKPLFKDNADITPVNDHIYIKTDSYPAQMSIDDLEVMRRSEIKEIVKEAIGEVLNSFSCKEIRGSYDPINRVYTVDFHIRGGD